MRVLAIDPGGTTGLAEWVDGQHRAWAQPLDEAQRTVHMHLSAPREERPDLLVIETIIITAQTLKKTRDVQDAIEFIGVTRYLARCYAVDFELQTPAEAKSFGSRRKIDVLGWKCPGPGDHAFSASQHLLLALAKRRLIDIADLAAKLR